MECECKVLYLPKSKVRWSEVKGLSYSALVAMNRKPHTDISFLEFLFISSFMVLLRSLRALILFMKCDLRNSIYNEATSLNLIDTWVDWREYIAMLPWLADVLTAEGEAIFWCGRVISGRRLTRLKESCYEIHIANCIPSMHAVCLDGEGKHVIKSAWYLQTEWLQRNPTCRNFLQKREHHLQVQ